MGELDGLQQVKAKHGGVAPKAEFVANADAGAPSGAQGHGHGFIHHHDFASLKDYYTRSTEHLRQLKGKLIRVKRESQVQSTQRRRAFFSHRGV